MIAADQPDCFGGAVIAGVSSRQDGTVLDRTRDARHDPEFVARRQMICHEFGIEYEACVYQIISYEPENTFDSIVEVDTPNTDGVHADVLYTETPGVGLFLPVADCIGTVIYDPRRKSLALAHIGRHASIADTLAKTITLFTHKGSRAEDLMIWMAPSVGKENYHMKYFDLKSAPAWRAYCVERDDGVYLDLRGYNRSRAIESGVPAAQISISSIDTASDANYFSHSQGDAIGRFAVVAMIRS